MELITRQTGEGVEELRVFHPPRVIGVAENVHAYFDEEMSALGYEIVSLRNGTKGEALVKILNNEDIDIVVTRTGLRFPREVLSRIPTSLIAGACKEPKVDLDAAKEMGIQVIKSDVNASAVAQLVMRNIYNEAAGGGGSDFWTNQGFWNKGEIGSGGDFGERFGRFDVEDITLGSIGFGNVAWAVAELAKKNGIRMEAYNNRSTERRSYDDELRMIAAKLGVTMRETKDEVLRNADFLTMHTGLYRHDGESNLGYMTEGDMRTFGQSGLGIVIDANRAGVIPDALVMKNLLRERVLRAVYVDVLPEGCEKNPGFGHYLMENGLRDFPGYHVTHHVGGSGEGVKSKTGLHLAERIPEWIERANLEGDVLQWKRQVLGLEYARRGWLSIAMVTSIRKNMKEDLNRLFSDQLGLDFKAGGSVDDCIPGEVIPYDFVPRLGHFAINGRDYGALVKDVVAGLAETEGVRSLRIMPTDDEQKAFFASRPRLAPNLGMI